MAVSETGFNSAGAAVSAPVAAAWAKWVNANGGIDGHPVDLIIKDSAGNPVTALGVLKQMVADGVVAVVLQDAGAEAAVGQYLQDQNMPVIGAEGYDTTTWSARPNFFSITTTNPTIQQAYVSGAQAVDGKTISVAYCAEVSSCQQTATVVSQQAAKVGIKYVGSSQVSASAPSDAAVCLSFMQKGAQVIAIGLTSDTTSRVVSDCQQQGFKGSYSVTSGAVIQKDFDATPGAKYVGVINAFPWWADAAPVTQFRDVMAKYAPGVDIRSTFPTSTWATLELFRKAVQGDASGLTPAKVSADYYALKGETLNGLLPQPMTFTRGEPAPKVTCFWVYSYTGGSAAFKSAHIGPSGNNATNGLSTSCIK
jgi:branched-chain amino acid transport system substrate-binding protein